MKEGKENYQFVMPKISIIVPVYKVEKYLRRCLDSIVNQTFTDWECILVDDGSPDNSGKICNEYAEKDERFRVFHQGNAGVSAARNKGLDEARGEWIGFVDSDDWIEAETYAVAYNRAVKEEVDLVQWGYIIEDNDVTETISSPEKLFTYKDAQTYWINACWNKLISKKIISNNRIFFPIGITMGEDTIFSYKCYAESKKSICLENCFYHYYMQKDSACRNKTSEQILQEERNIVHLIEYFDNKGLEIDNAFWLQLKCNLKASTLTDLDKPNFDLCRSLFAEINKCIINKNDLQFSFIYFWIYFHCDIIARILIFLKKYVSALLRTL